MYILKMTNMYLKEMTIVKFVVGKVHKKTQ